LRFQTTILIQKEGVLKSLWKSRNVFKGEFIRKHMLESLKGAFQKDFSKEIGRINTLLEDIKNRLVDIEHSNVNLQYYFPRYGDNALSISSVKPYFRFLNAIYDCRFFNYQMRPVVDEYDVKRIFSEFQLSAFERNEDNDDVARLKLFVSFFKNTENVVHILQAAVAFDEYVKSVFIPSLKSLKYAKINRQFYRDWEKLLQSLKVQLSAFDTHVLKKLAPVTAEYYQKHTETMNELKRVLGVLQEYDTHFQGGNNHKFGSFGFFKTGSGTDDVSLSNADIKKSLQRMKELYQRNIQSLIKIKEKLFSLYQDGYAQTLIERYRLNELIQQKSTYVETIEQRLRLLDEFIRIFERNDQKEMYAYFQQNPVSGTLKVFWGTPSMYAYAGIMERGHRKGGMAREQVLQPEQYTQILKNIYQHGYRPAERDSHLGISGFESDKNIYFFMEPHTKYGICLAKFSVANYCVFQSNSEFFIITKQAIPAAEIKLALPLHIYDKLRTSKPGESEQLDYAARLMKELDRIGVKYYFWMLDGRLVDASQLNVSETTSRQYSRA